MMSYGLVVGVTCVCLFVVARAGLATGTRVALGMLPFAAAMGLAIMLLFGESEVRAPGSGVTAVEKTADLHHTATGVVLLGTVCTFLCLGLGYRQDGS